MWQNLTTDQQQFLMAMLMRGQQGQMPGAAQMAPGLAIQTQPGMAAGMPGRNMAGLPTGLGNPLMAGGNSAVSPQQQAAMLQYQQLLGGPQGWGAAANGNVPVWQLLMGRSPWYGQGTSVP